MNIAQYSIKHKVITWMLVIILIGGGIFAFEYLGRLEDPEFTIKEAMIFTSYSGATAQEVETEVTEHIERAVQQLPQLKRVTSISKPGMSEVTAVIKDKYTKKDLPQIWDELRRKITDVQSKLPPGAGPSTVYDDYGEVFGMYFALTGEGFSYKELKDYADIIKRELLLVKGVGKVELSANRQQAVFVEISDARLSQLGISPDSIAKTLKSQNFVTYSGEVKVGDEYILINPTGTFSDVKQIGNILVSGSESKRLVHLDDVAKIVRGYIEVPEHLMRFNNQPAIGIGISIVSGGNVVKIGEDIAEKVKSLQGILPVGLKLNPVYLQPIVVNEAINGFLISLLEALAIVVVVLLLFMGLRVGILIGAILLLTVLGTFIFMYIFGIDLQRISLGALIIALGMLVDNAIVVTEGILVRIQKGEDGTQASSKVVKQTMWPLFGATAVGILAFAAIGLSPDSTGEYTRSLFQVILISLMLSWFLAITVSPMLCVLFIKPKPGKLVADPYQGWFYRIYRRFLLMCIRARWLTITAMLGLLALSIFGFGFVKQSFFPNSTTPVFLLDYWRAQGTDIRETEQDTKKLVKYVMTLKDVESVTSEIGQGAQRFMLVYTPEKPNSSYSQLVIRVKDYRDIDHVEKKIAQYLKENFPNSEPKFKRIRLGPGKDAKIEARFSGSNPTILRKLSNEAQAIMHQNPNAINIRDDWRQQVKVLQPIYSEAQARVTGITRPDLAQSLAKAFTGIQVGLYREGDTLLPIIMRPPENERLNVGTIYNLQIWSPNLKKFVPIGQVVSGFKTTWSNDRIARRNRRRTVTASTDPKTGPASELLKQLRPKIEALKLPTGYKLEWGGEYEDSYDAQVALYKQLPVGILAMIIIVVLLFSKVRQPLIIWLCVPLAFIGVTAGLLITNNEFGFMALLGFLSLIGMLIKNAIVLIDQIDLEIDTGKDPFQAIIDSAVSRVRPVSLAAITTVLGMIPLLFDAFFVSMAVVIMFGLAFATVLTLIVVPVLYAIFFKIPYRVLA